MNEIEQYPCQQLHGGTGSAICHPDEDGLCNHPECKPLPEPPNK